MEQQRSCFYYDNKDKGLVWLTFICPEKLRQAKERQVKPNLQ